MGTRRVSLVLAFVLIVLPVEGWAHRHRAGGAVGGREALRSDLTGFGLDIDFHFCKEPRTDWTESAGSCKVGTHPVSLLVGLGRVSGSHEVDLKQYTVMLGPRFAYTASERFQPFVHALAGVVVEDYAGQDATTSFAGSFGWGFDIGLRTSAGAHVPGLAIRPQLDMFWIDSEPLEWYPQVSLSFVIDFDW